MTPQKVRTAISSSNKKEFTPQFNKCYNKSKYRALWRHIGKASDLSLHKCVSVLSGRLLGEIMPASRPEKREISMSLEILIGISFICNGVTNEFCMVGV